MENIGRVVGERIGAARHAARMTQADLARAMSTQLDREIKPLIVTRIEGAKRPLSVEELVVIAQILAVPPAALLGGDTPAGETMNPLDRIRIDYNQARDELISAAQVFGAARQRWRAAHGRLRQAYDKAGLDDNLSKFTYGYDDTLDALTASVIYGDDEGSD